ncbi:MAG: metallophosphoesterase [Candidatus Bipolaricaulaceae bacterium]
MVWRVLLIFLFAAQALAWEITVAFTTDLHAFTPRFPALEPLLAQADLILDGGDAWEDPRILSDEEAAWATMRWMAKMGYSAMVLGNHETYLGPYLLGRILSEAPFAVLATNLRGAIPLRPYVLLEVKGLRILVLGVLWDLAVVWPGWELLDPLAAITETLSQAPEHDLFVLLGHMDTARAKELAAKLPEKCALFILGHDHKMYEEPVWVDGVPIVQAGSRGKAVGYGKLGPDGLLEYKLVQVAELAPSPGLPLWPFLAAALFVLGLR